MQRDFVPRAELEEARREIAELKIWKEAQEQRRARIYKPLKSGKGNVAAPMAEKLDHAELKTKLR